MRVLFVVDNRPISGRGHIVRCRALAAELEAQGCATEIIGPDGRAIHEHDVVVMDLLPDARAFLAPAPCVQILDDLTQVSSCDVLVNGSAGADVDMYAGVAADRVLAGPQFSLLRPEFVRARNKPQHPDGVIDLRTIAGWSAEELAEEVAGAAVAITYGGMRAMEAACVGTPTVIIPRNPGEKMNADGLMTAGACVVATAEEARVMAETMLECPRLLQKMGENARGLVDGRGIKRVAQVIVDLVK